MHVVELLLGWFSAADVTRLGIRDQNQLAGLKVLTNFLVFTQGKGDSASASYFDLGLRKSMTHSAMNHFLIKKVPLARIECKARCLMIRAYGKVVVLSGRHEAKP